MSSFYLYIFKVFLRSTYLIVTGHPDEHVVRRRPSFSSPPTPRPAQGAALLTLFVIFSSTIRFDCFSGCIDFGFLGVGYPEGAPSLATRPC